MLVRYRANIGALERRLAESTVEADDAAPLGRRGARRLRSNRRTTRRDARRPQEQSRRPLRRTQFHHPYREHAAQRSALQHPVGIVQYRPADLRIPRHPRRRHQRHAGVGRHHRIARPRRRRRRHRHRLQPSRPGGEHVDGAARVQRHDRQHEHPLQRRHARLQRRHQLLQSDGRSLARHARGGHDRRRRQQRRRRHRRELDGQPDGPQVHHRAGHGHPRRCHRGD